MGAWAEHLAKDGVRLSVYNPRSLLTKTLPLYERPAHAAEAPTAVPR